MILSMWVTNLIIDLVDFILMSIWMTEKFKEELYKTFLVIVLITVPLLIEKLLTKKYEHVLNVSNKFEM